MIKRARSTPLTRLLLIAAMIGIVTLITGRDLAADTPHEPLSAFPQSLLSIRTAAGKVINFQVWLADTPARQEQGLMFVRDIDEHAGMLFAFPHSQRLSMWMKNTNLPLDMVFIDTEGRILAVEQRTVPQSLDIISPAQLSLAVLELKGGSTESLGIRTGDTVVHPTFHNAK